MRVTNEVCVHKDQCQELQTTFMDMIMVHNGNMKTELHNLVTIAPKFKGPFITDADTYMYNLWLQKMTSMTYSVEVTW